MKDIEFASQGPFPKIPGAEIDVRETVAFKNSLHAILTSAEWDDEVQYILGFAEMNEPHDRGWRAAVIVSGPRMSALAQHVDLEFVQADPREGAGLQRRLANLFDAAWARGLDSVHHTISPRLHTAHERMAYGIEAERWDEPLGISPSKAA
jgi:hypothetical protein